MSDCAERADRGFAAVAAIIAESRIPGAVLGVLESGRRTLRWAGSAQILPHPVEMQERTVFDLASLTKPVFTTMSILRLVQEGRIALDDMLTVAIPDLRQYDVANAAERRLTFRQCLAHQTHLPHVQPLYTYGLDPATIRAFVLQRMFPAGPAVYSDINFMLLGIAIERLTGQPLNSQQLPQGLTFRPDPLACAATEFCTWRGRVLRGEVHDENAAGFGGVAGHAGLFGTADSLLDFAQSLLDGTALPPSGLATLRHRESPTRTLGWEAAHPGWSGGDMCSVDTIGHTGFTGTGLWIDFAHGRAWTLLTNRVHPSRHTDSGIFQLRRVVGDAVSAGAVSFRKAEPNLTRQ